MFEYDRQEQARAIRPGAVARLEPPLQRPPSVEAIRRHEPQIPALGVIRSALYPNPVGGLHFHHRQPQGGCIFRQPDRAAPAAGSF